MDIVWIIYLFSPVVVISAAVTSFIIAYRNRKYYLCEECGEKYKVEQMKARRCSVCGGELVEMKNKDIKKIKSRI